MILKSKFLVRGIEKADHHLMIPAADVCTIARSNTVLHNNIVVNVFFDQSNMSTVVVVVMTNMIKPYT